MLGRENGDQWVAYENDEQDYVQVGVWNTGDKNATCKSHYQLAGGLPEWAEYQSWSWRDFTYCCPVPIVKTVYAAWNVTLGQCDDGQNRATVPARVLTDLCRYNV